MDDETRRFQLSDIDDGTFDSHSLTPYTSTEDKSAHDETANGSAGLWRPELLRWIATLNPGRTQTEYQKAVRYFFETQGVPQQLDDLSFDLLLAYRGALALRATAHRHGNPRHGAGNASTRPAIAGVASLRLGAGADGDEAGSDTQAGASGSTPPGALSPATVNLRLTALRQFLVHCSLMGSLPQLTPDRIRAALRRMSVERRRPYQVLGEHEWGLFLEAARLPARLAPTDDPVESEEDAGALHQPDHQHEHQERGPWGMPRAMRQAAEPVAPAAVENGAGATETAARSLPRSHAGLTGRYTAQRDYALVSLALATGLRAIELAELDVGDIVREWNAGGEEWWLVLPDAKTKGQRGGRTLPMSPPLVETLLTYVSATGRHWDHETDQRTPLFLSGRRQQISERNARGELHESRLSPQQIRAIVDRVETQWLALREENAAPSHRVSAGETRKISPHALRHSTAIALLSGNDAAGRPPASVEHVRGWLGHFDIRTTQGYLAHLDARRHRRPFTLSPGAPEDTRRSAEAPDAPPERN